MANEVEDEIDWSDGPLDPPTPARAASASTSAVICHSPAGEDDSHDHDSLFEPDTPEESNLLTGISSNQTSACIPIDQSSIAEDKFRDYDSLFDSSTPENLNAPPGVPLNSTAASHSNSQPALSRAQRASLGVRLNRRIPSKEDYAHFALYQANQKAYEATFLKSFVTNALHRDRLSECFAADESREKIEKYLEIVSANVNHIANKMVWNAHCRAVNLLANDGKDGAPFLDVHAFDSSIFSDFGLDKPIVVARRLNESWHRAHLNPTMVRLSTREYPVGCHNSPLEELDEVANTLFHKDAFGKTLPTGRPTKAPGKLKGKGRDLYGAFVREEETHRRRSKWLAFPATGPIVDQHSYSTAIASREEMDCNEMTFEPDNGPQPISDVHSREYSPAADCSPHDGSHTDSSAPAASSTQLEVFLDRFGCNALDTNHVNSSSESKLESLMKKVPEIRRRMVRDHKRRLSKRWKTPPVQVLRYAIPGIREAFAQAIAMGCRPTAEDYQERIDMIEAREREQAHVGQTGRESPAAVEILPFIEPADYFAQNRNSRTLESQLEQMNVAGGSSKRKYRKRRNLTQMPTQLAEASQILSSKPLLGVKMKSFGNKRKTSMHHSRKDKQGQSLEPPKKKKRVASRVARNDALDTPTGLHPCGSKTLELHQILPPDAYFEQKSIDEKYAWRCGSNHAMGYYYNAGQRKSCPGCNVHFSGNQHTVQMDFYLPERSFFIQPAPARKWKPFKRSNKVRKCDRACHNSIAAGAIWQAIDAGWTDDEAHQRGIDAVNEHLTQKPKARKEPTLDPTPELEPESEPEPDLGPHPSGSTTMEHGQELPDCAYAEPQELGEELAWRCDVNHALGRYYLAGNKKSCPGCGTNKNGKGKQTVLDFYMPSGAVVRQEAPHLVKWKPRKYKSRVGSSKTKSKATSNHTHNQMCTETYYKILAQGYSEDKALARAIEATDKHLDEGNHETEHEDDEDQTRLLDNESSSGTRGRDHTSMSSALTPATSYDMEPSSSGSVTYSRHPSEGCTVSLGSRKHALEDVELDETPLYEDENEVTVISSDDEESSGSDSQ